MNKRKTFLIILLVIVLFIVGFGCYALFSNTIDIEQIINFGRVDLVVVEDESTPNNEFAILPGDVINKKIDIVNNGNHPLFIRVKINITIDGEIFAGNGISTNIDTSNWLYKDGYYYYGDVVNSGDKIPVFNEISIDLFEFDNSYLNKKFNVSVDVDGVQSENNGEDAIEAFGWPEE